MKAWAWAGALGLSMAGALGCRPPRGEAEPEAEGADAAATNVRPDAPADRGRDSADAPRIPTAAAEDTGAPPADARAAPDAPALAADVADVAADAGSPAQPLSGFRWDVPCAQAAFVTAELCTGPRALDWTRTFGGDPAKTYEVVLRFRGLVEPRLYLDKAGQRVTTVTPAPFFGVDVTPDPSNANYGAFALDIGAPKATHHLNVFRSIDGAFHHHLFPIDYTAAVKLKGGAAVKMSYRDGNTEFVANFQKQVITGVSPAPNPYNGQFVQMDVVSVKETE